MPNGQTGGGVRRGYVPALKGNQGTPHDNVRLFLDDPATSMAQATQVGKGHGRIETRVASVNADIAWLQERHDWPGLQAVGKVTATRIQNDEDSEQACYSLPSHAWSAEQRIWPSRETASTSPGETRYCLPPVFTMA